MGHVRYMLTTLAKTGDCTQLIAMNENRIRTIRLYTVQEDMSSFCFSYILLTVSSLRSPSF